MVIKKGIQKAVDAAIEAVKSHSQPVKGTEDIARIATISSADEDIGRIIADAMQLLPVHKASVLLRLL